MNRLKGLGIDIEQSEINEVEEYIVALEKYLKSYDFMRLGQAISHKQWQSAAMCAIRMTNEAKRLGIVGLERALTGVRQNVNRKNSEEALQALSIVISKRVKMLSALKELSL